MYLQKVKCTKNFFKQNLFLRFLKVFKVNDENSRIRSHDPDPDPLVKGMDLRIRIHNKISWICNTCFF
jgi:hypothetical protein